MRAEHPVRARLCRTSRKLNCRSGDSARCCPTHQRRSVTALPGRAAATPTSQRAHRPVRCGRRRLHDVLWPGLSASDSGSLVAAQAVPAASIRTRCRLGPRCRRSRRLLRPGCSGAASGGQSQSRACSYCHTVCYATGPRGLCYAVPESVWLAASTAWRMSWVAAAGWDTKETCEAGTSTIVALARSAMKRWSAGGIALS